MAKFYWSTLLWCAMICMNAVQAQVHISGGVSDGRDGRKLEKASIALIHAQDSILVRYARAQENGSFVLPKIDSGRYKLIVSYPKYADYSRDIYVQEESLDIGSIKLAQASLLLEEVQVSGKIPVVLKGDTIEYDAGSFKVDKDAKVEDLLKVLPGITMDATGKITAQGKEVKKVLLDGEEFFGDDPTLITKNIRSDMVSKVQVYEKKSDLADKTGVDDGERTQTIDIKLKEDSKKGMFGQAVGGAGTDNYYSGKVMANKFKGSQKIAAYGIYSNDGMVGLGFEDGQKYGVGGSSDVTMMDGGGMMISMNGDGSDGGWDGVYYGGGIPKALNFGASYSDKTANDKHKINVNFKRNQLNVNNTNTYFAQNNLPDEARIDESLTTTEEDRRSQQANLRYDVKLDSLSDLILKMGYSKSNNESQSQTFAEQQTVELIQINETNTKNKRLFEDDRFNVDLMLTRRFKKVRRSLTLNLNANTNQNNAKTNYFSEVLFSRNDSISTIDQFKFDKNSNTTLATSLTFTEPLSKRLTAALGYSFSNNRSETLNQSFDQDPISGLYDVLDENILNDFDFKSIKNGINTSLNYKDNALTVNLSNRVDFEDVSRNYNNLQTRLTRNQTSFTPNLSVNYKISKSKTFNFSYRGSSAQPSLTQIEPLKQNTQQLVEYLDNPNLAAGFNNNYSINFNSYKQLKDQSIYLWASVSQNVDPISSKIEYDQDKGTQKISYVNMEQSNWRANLNSGYRFVINKKAGINLNLGAGASYTSQFSYLSLQRGEPQLNKNEIWNFSPNIGLSRYRANKMDFYLNASPGIEKLESTLQPNLNSTTFKLNSYFNFTYYLPKDFKVSMNMQQLYQSATNTLQQINRVSMNGYISKKFLKDKSLESQLFVNDIFNRNNGINRYQNGSSFVQSSNEVLRRYAMFKLIYNFTTMKGGK